MADGRNPERHHVRRICDQKERNTELWYKVPCHKAFLRIPNPDRPHHVERNAGLQQAEQSLIDHVCGDIRTDMHSGPVFPFDHVTFPADHLNGIETAVPEAEAGDRQGTHKRPFHGREEAFSYYQTYQSRHHGGHGQHLPVTLVQEHSQQLPEVDLNLAEPAAIADSDPPKRVLSFFLRHAAPPGIL